MINRMTERFNLQYNGWRFNAFVCSILCAAMLLAGVSSAFCATLTEKDLKDKIEAATKDLKDLSMTVKVVDVDRRALEKTDSNYARLMDLKSAKIALKVPDKMRIEGKLGMVKFEYIVNGGIKISRAPAVRFKQKNDYTNDPAKLQGPFDIGLVTSTLWRSRKVELVDDAEAAANGEIKLKLRWLKGDMYYFVWLDAKDLWMKRMEKRDGKDNIRVKMVYSSPKNIGGSIWIPTIAEMYSAENRRVGKTEMTDIEYNIDLKDSLFQ
ncbi:MAG: hypothetical protein NT018_05400 [Armatimonadetes bacterium]|nr:hypothetical protein [Armatimonadota bacterium]